MPGVDPITFFNLDGKVGSTDHLEPVLSVHGDRLLLLDGYIPSCKLWSDIVVARWSRLRKLIYVGPG